MILSIGFNKKVLSLGVILIAFFSASCAEINLRTIPTPPPSAKLRIFVKVITKYSRGGWVTPHKTFEANVRNSIQNFLEMTNRGIYDLIPTDEVNLVIGPRGAQSLQWAKNDWAFTKEVGKRLHAEYALIVERSVDPKAYFQVVLININSDYKFYDRSYPTVKSKGGFTKVIRKSYRKMFEDAEEDLLSTAIRKGRIASAEIAETKEIIHELNKEQEKVVAAKFTKRKDNLPAEKTVAIDVNHQDKIAQLEAKLAKLVKDYAQFETMKKLIEEQRKKSDLLYKELEEGKKREKELLTKLEDSSKAPPVIVFTSPKDNSKTEMKFVHISGVVADEKGVESVEIFLNDNPQGKEAGRGLIVTKQNYPKRIEFKERISLEKGINLIKVRAVDSEHQKSEKTLTIDYIDRRKKIWVVIIGIDKYQKIKQLKYAVNDAKLFYDYMVHFNQVPTENITLLLDSDGTLQKIRSALGTILKKKAGKDDMVVIYFAGHGATEEDSFSIDGDGLEKYLLPFDANLNDLYSTALPMGELSRIFSRIKSERLIYIADSCYSGASGGRTIGISGVRANLSGVFMDRIVGGKGRVIIAASAANEVSKENDELKHGVFTYYLIDGLKGKADTDKDGVITVDEAYNYVSINVPIATGQAQHPVKKGNVEGQLILGIIE